MACHSRWEDSWLVGHSYLDVRFCWLLKEWYFQPTKVIVKAQRKRKYKLKVQQKGFFVHTSSLVPWFQTFQPVVGKGIANRVPGLDFIGKVMKGWYSDKSQLPGYHWWIVELIANRTFSRCEIGRKNFWRDDFFHNAGGFPNTSLVIKYRWWATWKH